MHSLVPMQALKGLIIYYYYCNVEMLSVQRCSVFKGFYAFEFALYCCLLRCYLCPYHHNHHWLVAIVKVFGTGLNGTIMAVRIVDRPKYGKRWKIKQQQQQWHHDRNIFFYWILRLNRWNEQQKMPIFNEICVECVQRTGNKHQFGMNSLVLLEI